jgi:hypothetical protein
MEFPHEIKHLISVCCIEVSGGLIGQQEAGVGGQRARDGNPLQLTAGQLIRKMMLTVAEVHSVQHLLGSGTGPARRLPGDTKRKRHVVASVQLVEQVVVLKNESYEAVPQPRTIFAVEPANFLSIELDDSSLRPIQ